MSKIDIFGMGVAVGIGICFVALNALGWIQQP